MDLANLNPDIRSIHDQAMASCDAADKAMRRGKLEEYRKHLAEAATLELKAARMVSDLSLQPTRSVLYRSAASLAYQCGEIATAADLAKEGRRGEVPVNIDDELRGLYRSATGKELPPKPPAVNPDEPKKTRRKKTRGKGDGLDDEIDALFGD